MMHVMYVCQFLGVDIIYYKRLHIESQDLAQWVILFKKKKKGLCVCVCVCVYYILYFIFIFIYVADMDFGLHIEGALCMTFFLCTKPI